jgi:hypothetical protein
MKKKCLALLLILTMLLGMLPITTWAAGTKQESSTAADNGTYTENGAVSETKDDSGAVNEPENSTEVEVGTEQDIDSVLSDVEGVEDTASEPEETDTTAAPETGNEEVAIETEISQENPDVDIADNDELFETYLEQIMYPRSPMVLYGMWGSESSTLNDNEKSIYNALKAKIKDVAANGGSTEFKFTNNTDISLDISFDAGDAEGNELGNLGSAAFTSSVDMTKVIRCLLVDCPYDLYWYDKAEGYTLSLGVGKYTNNNQGFIDHISIKFAVSNAYQVSGNQYSVDASMVQKAQTAAVNAWMTVFSNSSKSDYEKLVAYKDYICDAVSYGDANAEYGDVFQLIYVFDQDPSTNVVCEGYAKAFQYLCDLTNFTDGTKSYIVAGELSYASGSSSAVIGGHMWNIVTLNGNNYMVDITNCDGDAYAAPDYAFLKAPVSGSYDTGYVFEGKSSTRIRYCYDGYGASTGNITDIYPASVLTLSTKDFELLYGTVNVSGNYRYGDTVTATVANGPAEANYHYQWFTTWTNVSSKDGTNIAGATNNTFTVTENEIGKYLWVRVTADGYGGYIEYCVGLCGKAWLTAPEAPEVESYTSTSVTLKAEENREYNYGTTPYGYDLDGTLWTTDTTFTDLDPNTTYYFFARLPETSTHNASPSSTPITQKTKNQISSVNLTVDAPEKYKDLPGSVTITNTDGGTVTGTIEWYKGDSATGSPVTGKAEINQVYTAKITLTATNSDYDFGGTVTVSVNGENQNITASGTTLTLTKTFPATEDKEMTGIKVTTPPTNTEYTVGDSFDSTGMVVKAVYDDGSEEVITGYDIEPEIFNSVTDKVTITFNGFSTTQNVTVRAVPKYTVTVENGTSDEASYEEGETVTITAAAYNADGHFTGWTTDDADITIVDASMTETTFIMPDHAVTVTAGYASHSFSTDDYDCTTPLTCDDCEYTIPAQSHNYTAWASNGNDTHTHTCQNDGCTVSETKDCSGGTASYFNKAVCSDCHGEYGELMVDTMAPEGKIEVDTNSWTEFLNTITFGLFFNETQDVTITASDDSYSHDGYVEAEHAAKISYYLYEGSEALSTADLEGVTFTDYTDTFKIDPDNQYVIYVKITDHAGNVTYISSDGIVLDGTAPAISGIEDNGTYCVSAEFTVSDEHLDKVEIDGALAVADDEGKYVLTAAKEYEITATDKAGNVTTYNITVNATHTFTNYVSNGDATCQKDGTKTAKCDYCDATIIVDDVGSQTDHNLTHHKERAATCTDDGNNEYWQCFYCRQYFSDDEGDNVVTWDEYIKIDALGHDFSGDFDAYDENGHWHICNRCDVTDAPQEHIFTNYLYNGDASYFKDGTKTAVCDAGGCEHTDTLTAEGTKLTDTTLPEGEIEVDTNSWTEFLNTITFGLFFNETQDVTITANDDSYRHDGYVEAEHAAKIGYYLYEGSEALSTADLEGVTFTDYTDTFKIDPDNQYVIYVKITDHAGNVTYISSDGIVLDGTAPAISGIEDNGTYCVSAEFTVSDEHLDKVEIDGFLTVADGEGKYVITDAGTHTVTATDKAGNATIYEITINATHTLTHHDAVEPDCVTGGNVEYWSCSVCGKNFDAEGNELTTVELEALAHDCTYHPEVPATHFEEGKAAYYTCDRCPLLFNEDMEEVTEDQLILPIIPHTFSDKWSYNESQHWHECECGEKSDTAAHTFEWVVDKEAAEGVAGSKHKECTVCGYAKAAVEIPALDSGTGDKGDQTTDKGDSTDLKTGDESDILAWTIALLASGGVLTAIAGKLKRKKEK